jgi:hypothetical protein
MAKQRMTESGRRGQCLSKKPRNHGREHVAAPDILYGGAVAAAIDLLDHGLGCGERIVHLNGKGAIIGRRY